MFPLVLFLIVSLICFEEIDVLFFEAACTTDVDVKLDESLFRGIKCSGKYSIVELDFRGTVNSGDIAFCSKLIEE